MNSKQLQEAIIEEKRLYVEACAAHDKPGARYHLRRFLELQHKHKAPLTAHELACHKTPTVHAYGAVA